MAATTAPLSNSFGDTERVIPIPQRAGEREVLNTSASSELAIAREIPENFDVRQNETCLRDKIPFVAIQPVVLF